MIEWRQVTWYSQIAAIVLALVIFGVGFCVGRQVEKSHEAALAPTQDGTPIISDVNFSCDTNKTIHAIFRENQVQVLLSDGRNLIVPQAISGSGARYANDDESFVFWTKGNGAFITEGSLTTFANCVVVPKAPAAL